MVGSLNDRCSLECPGAMQRVDAKSPVRCLARWCPAGCGSLNGGGAYKACRLATSPCPVEYSCIPGCSNISSVVPVAEASFNLCPVLPVNGLLEDKTKSPCGRGSIVVYKNRL